MGRKVIFAILLALFISIIFLTVYLSAPSLSFAIQHNGRKKVYDDLSTDMSFQELYKYGDVLAFNFLQFGNEKKFDVDFYVRTQKQYGQIVIHEFKFICEGISKDVEINRTFVLNQQKTSFKSDSDPVLCESYYSYFPALNNEWKVDLGGILKEYRDEGRNIGIILYVYYSYDEGEVMERAFKYNAICYKRQKSAPDILYKLFPGM